MWCCDGSALPLRRGSYDNCARRFVAKLSNDRNAANSPPPTWNTRSELTQPAVPYVLLARELGAVLRALDRLQCFGVFGSWFAKDEELDRADQRHQAPHDLTVAPNAWRWGG